MMATRLTLAVIVVFLFSLCNEGYQDETLSELHNNDSNNDLYNRPELSLFMNNKVPISSKFTSLSQLFSSTYVTFVKESTVENIRSAPKKYQENGDADDNALIKCEDRASYFPAISRCVFGLVVHNNIGILSRLYICSMHLLLPATWRFLLI